MTVRREKSSSKSAVAILSLAAVLPLAWLWLQSLAENWRFPSILPQEFSRRSWSYLFAASTGVPSILAESIFIALTVTILAVLIALPAARAIALYDFKGKNWLLFALLLPILSPAITSAISGHALFLRYGLTDSRLGVILAHLVPTVPYCVLTLSGSFSRLDTDFEAQASNLGASRGQVWRFVTLPLIAPGLLTSAVFAFLISWSQYLTTLLIGGGKIVTLPMILVNFQRSGDEAVTAAVTLLFLAPVILFLAFAARFWDK
jgi:putative spermidine/putrescine transport system permease protein